MTESVRQGDVGGVGHAQLRSIVDRIERVEQEMVALKEDRTEIYAEAKGNGFDVKILRKLIALRKRDLAELDEEETLLEIYKRAVGMLPSERSDDETHASVSDREIASDTNRRVTRNELGTISASLASEPGSVSISIGGSNVVGILRDAARQMRALPATEMPEPEPDTWFCERFGWIGRGRRIPQVELDDLYDRGFAAFRPDAGVDNGEPPVKQHAIELLYYREGWKDASVAHDKAKRKQKTEAA